MTQYIYRAGDPFTMLLGKYSARTRPTAGTGSASSSSLSILDLLPCAHPVM